LKQDSNGKWRIVDVFLDGSISELATRRSEFSSIVERDGISALVNDLGEKSHEMGPS
jgi:phospholipid transport system substrate-binding protein